MKAAVGSFAVLFVFAAGTPLRGQVAPAAPPSRAQVIAAAKTIMQVARYTTLMTVGPDGQPQARIVDPFLPDSDLTIWIATNPLTRKVAEIRRDPRVTLLYFSPSTFEYVTVIGTAAVNTDSREKASHWKAEWATMYHDQNRGDDYLLLRVRPTRLEVVSARQGMRNDPKTWRPVIVDVPGSPLPPADTSHGPEFLASPGTVALSLPFSDAVRAGDLLFVSGQVGTAPGKDELVPGGIGPEATQALENVKAILERNGSSMAAVAKCTAFLADIQEWAAFNAVYRGYFPTHFPARSAFGSTGLALGARVELDCTAYAPQSRT